MLRMKTRPQDSSAFLCSVEESFVQDGTVQRNLTQFRKGDKGDGGEEKSIVTLKE